MSLIDTLTLVVGACASVAAVLTPPAIVGKIPRLGPGRAIALGLRGRIASIGTTRSQRGAEVAQLRRMLDAARMDEYCVVQGPKGVGKCAWAP
jgi:hypothetical protein